MTAPQMFTAQVSRLRPWLTSETMPSRRGAPSRSFESSRYWLARVLGDVQAIRSGPRVMAKRLARQAVR